jgi:uncharacterized protein (UPF0276 family)
MKDRVGLGWRAEIAAAILAHAERLDVVEVIAEEWFDAPRRRLRVLSTLGAQVPVLLHGVSLGLAGSQPVEDGRLRALARLVAAVRPLAWSEHLAFVRAGRVEIGHLAAPPRTPASLEDLRRNVERACAVVGARPLLENVATLVDPPGSTLDEPGWIAGALEASGCDLLLDLHNLHANAANFGHDPRQFLGALPLERVRAVHLAGGRPIAGRILDDHLHDVPAAVYELLEELAARTSQPLTVVLERDGEYPPFEVLLAQLERARAALAAGRARRGDVHRSPGPPPRPGRGAPSDPRLQEFLAGLYVDGGARARFLADPRGRALRAGLDRETAERLERVDRAGLELAAHSFAGKRAQSGRGRRS